MEVSGQPHASATLPRGWDNAQYPLNERLVGPHSRSVRFREETCLLLLLGIEPQIVQPVSCRYGVWGTGKLFRQCFAVFGRLVCCVEKIISRVFCFFKAHSQNYEKATISFVTSFRPSVRPHGTTRPPLDGHSWKFIFANFSKICRENSIHYNLPTIRSSMWK